MSLELDVLRALLRLARRRSPPTLEQITERVSADGDEAAVRTVLQSLARSGLVQRSTAGLRLSLAGLAVAVACAQRPHRARRSASPAGTSRKPNTLRRIGAARSTERADMTSLESRRSRHRAA